MIYLDANILIYIVESDLQHRAALKTRLDPHQTWFTSELSRLESRVLPLRNHDAEMLQRYDLLLAAEQLQVRPIDSAIIDLATELRATHRSLRTPDALHLATSLSCGAAVFLTGDARLARNAVAGVTFELLQ